MEDIKQKVVLPTKGICNTTPDPICGDDELLDSVGLTYFNDALRPIQKTAELSTISNGTLMFVHRLNDGTTVNYITATYNTFYWDDGAKSLVLENTDATIESIKSVGNTLIVLTSEGLYYYLWSDGEYHLLGDKIPEPECNFMLYSKLIQTSTTYGSVFSPSKSAAIEIDSILDSDNKATAENVQGVFDAAASIYAEAKNGASNDKMFHSPFFLMYAIELYDGTFTMASNPILMLPSFYECMRFWRSDGKLYCTLNCAKLQYKMVADYSLWTDIVKNVSIFVSPSIELYNTSTEYATSTNWSTDRKTYAFLPNSDFKWEGIINAAYYWYKGDPGITPLKIFDIREQDEVNRELVETSNFYKIAEITEFSEKMDNISWSDVPIKSASTLKNLTTQQSLDTIEYYSHCTYVPAGMETFNRRLNIYNVRRSFFKGFKQFVPLNNSYAGESTYRYTIEVTIKINGAENVVKYDLNSRDVFYDGMWFYYPDPRATKVNIIYHTSIGDYDHEYELKEHHGLNGAYCFSNFPYGYSPSSDTSKETSTLAEVVTLPEAEYLNNYLLQSDVDNPFTFTASGYIRVGQGKIIGMAGLTTALSQDAYKISTTLVFTTQGIWALKINDEGQYVSVAPPFSREVCVNTETITMVDNAVYFVSEKGLMLITDDGIKCVSSNLRGKNPDEVVYDNILGSDVPYTDFMDFIKNCKIAYDYKDSQLILTNIYSDDSEIIYDYHWVYNINTGTFSRFKDGNIYKAIVCDYPDTLLHDTNSIVHSVLNEPDINDDMNAYDATIITRPMKFEKAMALKSLRDLKHIKDLNTRETSYSDKYDVDVESSGTGGTITGGGTFNVGAKASLTITPDENCSFIKWTTGSKSSTITIPLKNKSYSAIVKKPKSGTIVIVPSTNKYQGFYSGTIPEGLIEEMNDHGITVNVQSLSMQEIAIDPSTISITGQRYIYLIADEDVYIDYFHVDADYSYSDYEIINDSATSESEHVVTCGDKKVYYPSYDFPYQLSAISSIKAHTLNAEELTVTAQVTVTPSGEVILPGSSMSLTIFATNDTNGLPELDAEGNIVVDNGWREIPSLRGRGYKYYIFRYDFTNLKAYDAFCGTVLYYTTRETDRLR